MNVFSKLIIGLIGVEYLKNRLSSGIKEGFEQVNKQQSSITETKPQQKSIPDQIKGLTFKQKIYLTINLLLITFSIVVLISALFKK